MARRWKLALATALICDSVATPAHADEKFALAVFHFNVQYVAGGLVAYPLYGGTLRPEEVEDQIIVESLIPVLEMYAAHPDWGVDIELQGYLLDVLAARHPDTLDLLRDLATSGQIDVVSFHYSDQLYIAYPQEDWARSQALTVATFAKHNVPLSTSVFCQEGQAGEALADRFAELDYTTMVWPKNLWTYQHGDFAPDPIYRFGDGFMVAGGLGVSYDDGTDIIEMTWTFLDDGEKLATNDWDPYFPDLFVHDPAAVTEYEDRLLDLEADGFRITPVSTYIETVSELVTPSDPPALLDGTWQPGSTDAVWKWMGNRSTFALGGPPHDRDNHVRTLGYLAHRELVAAETAAAVAGLDERARLDAAWRLLALGQVTDATGINPYRGEVQYGIAHLSEVIRVARDVIEASKSATGDATVVIDPEAGSFAAGSEEPFVGTDVAPLFDVTLEVADPVRQTNVAWEEIEPGHYRVSIFFGPGEEGAAETVAVTFPGTGDALITTRALDDFSPRTYQRGEFAFGEFHMALPLGLIGLGDGRFLIKDTGQVHIAANVRTASSDVTFRDQTLQTFDGVTWVFHVFEGSADQATALARRINSQRSLVR